MPKRRSKNQNLKGCYTYHERQKDKEEMQYGNFERRLGKDSIKDFDMCAIGLTTCKFPVVSEQGVIFDKEQVLKYIIEQKKDIKRQSEAYKQYVQELKDAENRSARIKKQKELNQFIKQTDSLVVRTDPLDNPLRSVRGEKTPAINGQFWQAGTVRDTNYATLTDGKGDLKRTIEVEDGLLDGTGFGGAMRAAVKKPDKHVRCPVTKEPLDFAKLLPVNFQPINKAGDSSSADKPKPKASVAGGADVQKISKYCCAITGDPLTNSTKLIVFKKGGEVILKEAFDKVVKKTMTNPFTNEKITEKDYILLRRGGTGFSQTNDLQRTEQSSAFMAS